MTTHENFTSPCKGEVGREAAGRGSNRRFARTAEMTKRARNLRGNQTDAEVRLWQALRRNQINGLSFRRQHPIGRYILDFYCPALKLAIELDGGQHATVAQARLDHTRTRWIALRGIRVFRFWNNDILSNIDCVRAEIPHLASEALKPQRTPSPTLPLSGGGRGESLP
ncbi:MAG TPA: endonuclease domain-containing protein [Pseudolabrys sp.]|nr:endonuclease domain-containing protein [Pseudolabrys sp.]